MNPPQAHGPPPWAFFDDVSPHVLGDGQLTVNVFDENVSLGKDVDINAQIRAWSGDVNTGSKLAFVGTIQAAGAISIGSGGSVTYGGSHTPEPATLALLGLGGAGMLWRRRRRK